jgi:nitrite reductase (cytochrome c-552)
MDKKSRIVKTVIALAVVLAAILLIGGFVSGADVMYHLKNRGELGPLSRDDIEYLNVEAPAATSRDGTVSAADWAEVYPYIVATMGDNKENSYVVDYLEQDPYLVNIYEGYGFAKDYGSARGHEYCLEDVNKTQRPHAKANCLTCKTPNFTKLVNDLGVSVYSMPFEDANALMEENVSCYTCHGNDPGNGGKIVITHSYVHKALGENVSTIDPAILNCGQCHIEYYFTPADSETMMPYSSIETMSPEAILEYYNTMEMPDGSVGYYDWVQESTGAKMLKAQHPEMETFMAGKHAGLLNCADCHMAITQADDGTVYHSHLLESPLDNPDLLTTCAECHGDTDMVSFVHKLQDRITARETEVGNKLADFNDTLADAVAAGEMTDEELDEVRQVYREAQWFFDFCYVENSEGAHNSELSMSCLDIAEAKIDEAMALLAK